MGAESDDTLRALVAALSDEDHHVRTDAALALWHIRRDPLALNCLRDLSQNCAEEKIRRYAARLLYNVEKEPAADTDEGTLKQISRQFCRCDGAQRMAG